MPLSVEEIRAIVEELERELPGARVEKVQERDEHSIVLALHVPRPPAATASEEAPGPEDPAVLPRKVHFLLTARPRFERFHLLRERGPIRESPGPFTMELRRRLVGARVRAFRQPGRGRAVEVDLDEAAREDERPGRLILVAELSGRAANLVLLDRGRHLAASLRPVRAGGEELAPGAVYAMEGSPPHPSAMAGVAASPWRYLPGAEVSPASPASPLEARFPFNLALGSYYAGAEERALLEDRRAVLRKALDAALGRRRTLLGKLREDLAGAREGEGSLRTGELLKGELHRLRKGMDRIELTDWYDPAQPTIAVPLDPARTPMENVERCFHRYRKAQRAIPFILERAGRIEGEIGILEEAAGAAGAASGEEELGAIEERLRPLLRKRPAGKARPAEEPAAAGPRRFRSAEGIEILVGRSARENDELTFRIARGNDVFLHVSGRPGAHVIVRADRDHPPPLEALLDAAVLALYFSLPVRSRGGIARGAAGEVDYVEVKHVRKPRGGGPGEVLLARHKTLRVVLEEGRLGRLLGGEPGNPR